MLSHMEYCDENLHDIWHEKPAPVMPFLTCTHAYTHYTYILHTRDKEVCKGIAIFTIAKRYTNIIIL